MGNASLGDTSHNQLFKSQTFPKDNIIVFPNELETDAEGKTWIADGENGLISDFSGSFKPYNPNGVKGDIFSIFYQNQKIFATGITGNRFEENEWKTLTISQLPFNQKDIIDRFGYRWQMIGGGLRVINDATNQSRYYYSGKGSGNLPSSYVNTIAKDKDDYFGLEQIMVWL